MHACERGANMEWMALNLAGTCFEEEGRKEGGGVKRETVDVLDPKFNMDWTGSA